MAVLRQANLLGDQRIDVPHLRALESATAADFDVVAGRVQGGGKALIIRGFELSNYTAGTSTSSIQLNTADGVLYNQNATESGTFLWVPLDRPVEVLDSALNARVDGSFVAGAVNYIGIDLTRQADSTTTDHVKFLDANTLLEQGYEVPLARTLDYRIIITSTPFSALPHLTPIAKITSDANNQVVTVEDARNIMWRLGSGGDFPNTTNSFAWPQDRVEAAGAFSGGDKGIVSQKDWQDAVMSRVWEIGGGENWYSPTADRNVKLAGNPGSLFTSTADNFEWVAGLYTSTHLHWKGLKFLFDNANTAGVYYNTITDQLVDDPAGSAALSKTVLAIGDCLYVDLDRSSNATLTAQKAAMQTLGEPAVPGSRIIVAWRNADGVFRRDGTFAVNTSFAPATTVAIGAVRLAYTEGTLGTPTVLPLNANNAIRVGEGSYPVTLSSTAAIYGKSTGTDGFGVYGESTGTLSTGVYGVGVGWGVSGSGATGVLGAGSAFGVDAVSTNGTALRAVSTNAVGVYAQGGTIGVTSYGVTYGVEGVCSGGSSNIAVYGHSSDTGSQGVVGCGMNRGVYGGPGTTGNMPVTGVYGQGSTAGVEGESTSTALWGHGGLIGCYGGGTMYGVQGNSAAIAVYGNGGATGVKGDGSTDGGRFTSTSTSGGHGCVGLATGVSGANYGGYFAATDGMGVYSSGTAYGVQAFGYSSSGIGVEGSNLYPATSGTQIGVKGVANSGSGAALGYGVMGDGLTHGVNGFSSGGAGVYGASTSGVGGQFVGNATRAPINVGIRTAAPTIGVAGDVYFDSSDGPGSVVLHVCLASGTPGTWKSQILT